MTAREVERLLTDHGFKLVSQSGSHRKWRHPETQRVAIVPWHAGAQLPLGTIRSIMTGADIPEHAWRDEN